MNRSARMICAVLIFSMACLAQKFEVNAPRDEKLAAQLLELKRRWGKIYVERDRAALERLLGKEYTVTDETGTTTDRQTIVADFETGETVYQSTAYEDARVSIYGNVAIVAGRGTVKGRNSKGAFATEYFSTNVFVKRDGRWQAVATHISGAKSL